ncbi:MAG: DUF4294 domain-containing protein [Chitinophagaceae bacterium]
MFLAKAKYYILLFLFASIIFIKPLAQKSNYDTLKLAAWISPDGDTLALSFLPIVEVTTHKILTREERRKKEEWTRLRNAVYVTYPYAKAASRIMNEINAKLVGVTDRKQRKLIIKSREKELRKEFTDKLTNLSIYQGKVLMKLIYRETGNNCYEIIEEYKGGFTAALYQTIAVVVGTNLKQNYDASSKDRELEFIVRDIERMYGYRS